MGGFGFPSWLTSDLRTPNRDTPVFSPDTDVCTIVSCMFAIAAAGGGGGTLPPSGWRSTAAAVVWVSPPSLGAVVVTAGDGILVEDKLRVGMLMILLFA